MRFRTSLSLSCGLWPVQLAIQSEMPGLGPVSRCITSQMMGKHPGQPLTDLDSTTRSSGEEMGKKKSCSITKPTILTNRFVFEWKLWRARQQPRYDTLDQTTSSITNLAEYRSQDTPKNFFTTDSLLAAWIDDNGCLRFGRSQGGLIAMS